MFRSFGCLRGRVGRHFSNKQVLSSKKEFKTRQSQYEARKEFRKTSGVHQKLELKGDQEKWRRRLNSCQPKAVQPLLTKCIQELEQPHSAIFLYGMRNLDNNGDRRRAQLIFHQMQENNISPDLQTYDFYIRLCNRLGDFQLALDAASDLKKKNMEPNIVLYSNLVQSYAELGKLSDFLAEVEASAVEKNLIFYSNCVKICTPSGDINRASEFYNEMKSNGIKPDSTFVVVFLGVIKEFVKNGGAIEKLKDFLILFEKEVSFNSDIYNSILSIHAAIGDVNGVEALHSKMLSEEMVDLKTPNIICDAYATKGETDYVMRILDQSLNPAHFTLLIKGLEKANKLHRTPGILEKYPQFLGNHMCSRSVFNCLYYAEELTLLDEIYEKHYNVQHLPFQCDKNREWKGKDTRPKIWDLQRYSIGISVACIRFGAKNLEKGKWEVILVGHQRNARSQSLKNELLSCPHVGDVEFKHDENAACLQIRRNM